MFLSFLIKKLEGVDTTYKNANEYKYEYKCVIVNLRNQIDELIPCNIV